MKASELKKGMVIKEENSFFMVVDVDHKTPGNLRAIYQVTLKNLVDPKIVNRRYSPADTVEKAVLESKKGQYLFHDHAGFHFMDMETYETLLIPEEMIGSFKDFLKENLEVAILSHEHRTLTIELPITVDLKVVESAPGVRGDTSGRATKQAKLETGFVANVPLFIEEGDVLKIDTRDGQYLGRA